MNIPENAIQTLTVEDMYNKEKYDLETMEEEDLFEKLNARRDGLTDEEVNERLEKFGRNGLEWSKRNSLIEFLLFMWNPLSWVMIEAAVLTILLSNGGGRPPDWEVFIGIIFLLLANSIIGFVGQRNARNAVQKHLTSSPLEAKVKHNCEWKVIQAAELVPGDIISVRSGDVVPADARLISK